MTLTFLCSILIRIKNIDFFLHDTCVFIDLDTYMIVHKYIIHIIKYFTVQ